MPGYRTYNSVSWQGTVPIILYHGRVPYLWSCSRPPRCRPQGWHRLARTRTHCAYRRLLLNFNSRFTMRASNTPFQLSSTVQVWQLNVNFWFRVLQFWAKDHRCIIRMRNSGERPPLHNSSAKQRRKTHPNCQLDPVFFNLWIRDGKQFGKHPGSYFRKLGNNFLSSIYLNSSLRIRI